jgi:hypothetical protein
MKRILLAGLLGGIAMFLWSSVAHLVLPLGQAGIGEIPNEQPVLTALRSSLGASSGLYLFPGLGPGPDAMRQYGQLLAANPSGLLIYHPPGAQAMTAGQLATEFIAEVIQALLLAVLLASLGRASPVSAPASASSSWRPCSPPSAPTSPIGTGMASPPLTRRLT